MEINKTNEKKRQRRSTSAERAEILAEFQRSGMTRLAFSRTHNVALSTLSKWLYNAKHKSKNSAPVLFKELRVPQSPAVAAMAWAVEIVSPDGMVIRCREALPLRDASWLLRGR
jgi:transposase-like protein